MSNRLYEQVKAKVEASPLAQAQIEETLFDWHEIVREAERLRSSAVARAGTNLYANSLSAIAILGAAVDRARRANLTYDAGNAEEARKPITVSAPRGKDKKAA